MSEVTRLLDAAAAGDRKAAADLLPLVYDDLRKLAAARMADESPEHTLQPTAPVHEAYLRLVGPTDEPRWQNRGHFFAAGAEATRRILVDAARREQAPSTAVAAFRRAVDRGRGRHARPVSCRGLPPLDLRPGLAPGCRLPGRVGLTNIFFLIR